MSMFIILYCSIEIAMKGTKSEMWRDAQDCTTGLPWGGVTIRIGIANKRQLH